MTDKITPVYVVIAYPNGLAGITKGTVLAEREFNTIWRDSCGMLRIAEKDCILGTFEEARARAFEYMVDRRMKLAEQSEKITEQIQAIKEMKDV